MSPRQTSQQDPPEQHLIDSRTEKDSTKIFRRLLVADEKKGWQTQQSPSVKRVLPIQPRNGKYDTKTSEEAFVTT